MSAPKVLVTFFLVMLAGAILVGGCGYSGYRRTINMDEGVKSAWADVDVALMRRFDLISNIVDTVKAYAKQEKDLLQGIADARANYTGAATIADKSKVSSQLDGFLSRLLVIQERYPELKSNQNFRDLQVTLEGSENRIGEMRKRYNDAAKSLNAYIRAFPGSLYAGWAAVKPAEYFQAGEEAREAPKVKF
jgi:LemA protein